jgi:hypothetical protein
MPKKRMHFLKRINGKVLGGGMFCLITGIVILVLALHQNPEGIQSGVLLLVKGLFCTAAASIVWGVLVMFIFGIPTDDDWYWDRTINWKFK